MGFILFEAIRESDRISDSSPEGEDLGRGTPAGGAVSSRPVNADGSPQRISYEVFDFDNLAGFDWDEGNKQKN